MKTLPVFFASLILFSGCADGGGDMGNSGVAGRSAPETNAFIVVPADIFAVRLELKSEQSTVAGQMKDLYELRSLIVAAASKIEGYQNQKSGTPYVYSDFRKFDSAAKRGSSRTMQITLNFSIPKDSLEFTVSVLGKLDEVEIPKKATYSFRFVSVESELKDAEVHRPAVMEKVRTFMSELKKDSTSKLILTLDSLEAPLVSSPYGEDKFIVSLPYKIKVESIVDNTLEE